MNQQQPQQPTPEQEKKIKGAKTKLWLGIIVIVVVGLLIAVYFVFLQSEEGNTNNVVNSNTISNINIATNKNTNTAVSAEPIQFPDTKVGISCTDNEDCIIADKTESVGDCCPTPDCKNWYTSDNYVAVNLESYNDKRTVLRQEARCDIKECPGFPPLQCLSGEPYAGADCQEGVCAKVLYNMDATRTYTNDKHGYSLQIPAGYGKNLVLPGYLALDVVTASSADLTFNRIIVTVSDIDIHTHRLEILTDPAANTDNITEKDVTVSGLTANKLALKNALGETIIHYLVSYLGKVYDIETTDSVAQDLIETFLENFAITQLDANIDISDPTMFENKSCVSNNECGAFPCVSNKCLVKECTNDSECSKGTCGQYVTPVPGYCTMMDSL